MTNRPTWEAKIDDYFWSRPTRSPATNLLIRALRMTYAVVRDLQSGRLNLRAMGLVYTTLLSIVPLLAISLSVLKGFGVHNEMVPLLRDLLSPLGEKGDEITEKIFEFVDNTRVGVLSSVGIVLLLYTAFSVMQKVESALNFIWHVEQPRRLAQRFSEYLSILLIGPVLVVASTGLSGAAMSNNIVEWLSAYEPVGILIRSVSLLVPLLLGFAAFTMIYVLVPNTKVKPASAMIGGATAAILWKLAGWAFAAFVVSSGRYEAVYSAFATLMVFMIWLYTSWLILMVGATVAFYHQNPAYLRVRSDRLALSARVREKLALMVMHKVATDFYAGRAPVSAAALADACGVPRDAATAVIDGLVAAGLLIALDGDEPRYLPARPLDETSVAAVLGAARAAEESGTLAVDSLAAHPDVEAAWSEYGAAVDRLLDDRSVKDLAVSGAPGRLKKAG